MRKALCPALVLALLAGCGGDSKKEVSEAELRTFTSRAHLASSKAHTYCAEKIGADLGIDQAPSGGELGEIVDGMIDNYAESGKHPEVKAIMREAANSMRDCDENSAADRLSAATDAD